MTLYILSYVGIWYSSTIETNLLAIFATSQHFGYKWRAVYALA